MPWTAKHGPHHDSIFAVNTVEFEEKLMQAYSQLANQSKTKVEATVIKIVTRMKQLCPYDTGKLKSSIGWRETSTQSRVVLKGKEGSLSILQGSMYGKPRGAPLIKFVFGCINDAPYYAMYVEYGTSLRAAHPFFRPAIAEVVHISGPLLGSGGRQITGTPKNSMHQKADAKMAARAQEQRVQ